jgi:hypothetical protein
MIKLVVINRKSKFFLHILFAHILVPKLMMLTHCSYTDKLFGKNSTATGIK